MSPGTSKGFFRRFSEGFIMSFLLIKKGLVDEYSGDVYIVVTLCSGISVSG